MKSKDIKAQYGVDERDFAEWIKTSQHPHKSTFTGSVDVEDSVVENAVNEYRAYCEERAKVAAAQINADREKLDAQMKEERELKDAQMKAEQEKKQALANMLVTSGFNFDGYTITKYSGYISGDDAVSMDRPSHGFWGGVHGNVGADLLKGLSHIRRNALAELKEAAYALGCNAVIGVDFDYLTLDPETVNNQGGVLYLPFLFAITANGNAVIIEKN
jgi:uncharacterized protein YbjQ (UPF0145 family)